MLPRAELSPLSLGGLECHAVPKAFPPQLSHLNLSSFQPEQTSSFESLLCVYWLAFYKLETTNFTLGKSIPHPLKLSS